MPKIAEFAAKIIDIVSAEFEVPREMIISKSRNAEAVDARRVVAMLLYRSGIYVSRIAETLRISPRYVQYIVTDFEDQLQSNRPLRMTYERVQSRLTPILQNQK